MAACVREGDVDELNSDGSSPVFYEKRKEPRRGTNEAAGHGKKRSKNVGNDLTNKDTPARSLKISPFLARGDTKPAAKSPKRARTSTGANIAPPPAAAATGAGPSSKPAPCSGAQGVLQTFRIDDRAKAREPTTEELTRVLEWERQMLRRLQGLASVKQECVPPHAKDSKVMMDTKNFMDLVARVSDPLEDLYVLTRDGTARVPSKGSGALLQLFAARLGLVRDTNETRGLARRLFKQQAESIFGSMRLPGGEGKWIHDQAAGTSGDNAAMLWEMHAPLHPKFE